jgi:glc operon protein GlcG
MRRTVCLGLAEAQEMIEAVRRRLEADGKAAAIAVTDPHGELIAFQRMDGCALPPGPIAISKAFTAAREGRPSGAVGEAARAHGFPITNYGDLRYTGWAGGAPVIVDGQVAGAIGISGIDDVTEVALAAMAADLAARR